LKVARIQVDAGTLDRSEVSGQVTAGIWLSVNGWEFPGIGWDDFVVVVLTWWTAALIRVIRGESDRERVYFKDGPYSVEIVRTSHITWRIAQEEDRKTGRIVTATVDISPRPLIHSVVAAADEILSACESRGWNPPEGDQLVSMARELRRLSLD
jgi:hypothetical protein